MDVKMVFLYGGITKDIYMEKTIGVEKYENRVYRLNKSLFALKKTPRSLLEIND